MPASQRSIRVGALALVLAAVAGLGAAAFWRLDLEADILSALPAGDPVLQDGRDIMGHHPQQDRVVIDVGLEAADADLLVAGAALIEADLAASGLFASVGLSAQAAQVPALIDHIVADLPALFSARELELGVAPCLSPERVRERLAASLERLGDMEGVGQARWTGADPLELRGPVLSRLRHLAPSAGARIYRGQLISGDNRHLLLVAVPRGSGTDTAFGRAVMQRLAGLEKSPELARAGHGQRFTLTPVGAFRAALDNETAAKGDVRRLAVSATAGIGLLLLLCFSRPYLGLFAFLPALAGSAAALFIFSLFQRGIFLMTLGFGGAVISITVDHGIAYLLFLDQPRETRGREAAREVRAVGLLATLTSVGAFLALTAGGFPILAEIGLFAALGIGCSFAFVHLVFPLLFPLVPPARTQRRMPLRRLIEGGAGRAAGPLASLALVFGLVMFWFARPEFSADLKRMNTVSEATRAAEDRVSATWGDLFSRVFLMAEADSLEALQQASDRILDQLEKERATGAVDTFFVPSMIFPGSERRAANREAWKAFWTPERAAQAAALLRETGAELGFAPEAFAQFLQSLQAQEGREGWPVPAGFFDLLGISAPGRSVDGQAPWRLFAAVTPGPAHEGSDFSSEFRRRGARVFDPGEYARRLGEVLAETFARMLGVIGISVALLLLAFYRSWRLTLVSLLPVAFSLVCTLGTLKLAGRPLDLAALMLSIIVAGMGVDYALFLVRAYQRYGGGSDPRVGLVRVTIFLAAASTLIGFGTMGFARHLLLRSAGFTCFFGILYAYAGAVLLLPPILDRILGNGREAMGERQGKTSNIERPTSKSGSKSKSGSSSRNA